MKIAFGSRSTQQIQYVKEVCAGLGLKAEIFPFDVEGNPHGNLIGDEVAQASAERSKLAFRRKADVDFALGIEAGFGETGGKIALFAVATIMDHEGNMDAARSQMMPLPEYCADLVRNGEELTSGKIYSFSSQSGNLWERKYLDHLRDRDMVIKTAIQQVFLTYLGKIF